MLKKGDYVVVLTIATLTMFSPTNILADEVTLTKTSKIIGGISADSDEWPWMAGLVRKNSVASDDLFCGASLIAKSWVLTAAHCVINEDSTSLDVIINRAQLTSNNGERLSVKRIIVHPLFDRFTFENDLALIELHTPSNFSPIKVLSPYTFQDEEGKLALALGWGTTSTTGNKISADLQQAELSIIDNATCSLSMSDVTENSLCAGDIQNQRDTCLGDSGGPLIVFDNESNSWRQAGITSWGIGCAQENNYGVYTRVKNYASFISENICSIDEIPSPVSLNLFIDGEEISATWSTSINVSGYRLNYAPYPDARKIYSVDMNQLNQLSVTLDSGNAFYVAITSYIDNCVSNFSNIEHFIIN